MDELAEVINNLGMLALGFGFGWAWCHARHYKNNKEEEDI